MDYTKEINEELAGEKKYKEMAAGSSGIEAEMYRAMAKDECDHAHCLMKIAKDHGVQIPADHPNVM